MNEAVHAFIALGSNLGDRRAHLLAALRELEGHDEIELFHISTIIESDPVGPPGQGPYLNAVAQIETTFAPRTLLDDLLRIECAHGRDRTREVRNGPRTLDLDVLLYGSRVIDEPGLHVPHPRMLDRRFVLGPLCEIAPDLVHPRSGRAIKSLLQDLLVQSADE